MTDAELRAQGLKIKIWRLENHLSVDEICHKTGISKAAWWSWEGGRRAPSMATLARAVKAYPDFSAVVF